MFLECSLKWTITAIGDKKKKIGKAKATREYPE